MTNSHTFKQIKLCYKGSYDTAIVNTLKKIDLQGNIIDIKLLQDLQNIFIELDKYLINSQRQ